MFPVNHGIFAQPTGPNVSNTLLYDYYAGGYQPSVNHAYESDIDPLIAKDGFAGLPILGYTGFGYQWPGGGKMTFWVSDGSGGYEDISQWSQVRVRASCYDSGSTNPVLTLYGNVGTSAYNVGTSNYDFFDDTNGNLDPFNNSLVETFHSIGGATSGIFLNLQGYCDKTDSGDTTMRISIFEIELIA